MVDTIRRQNRQGNDIKRDNKKCRIRQNKDKTET
jgi:hypothetical protein